MMRSLIAAFLLFLATVASPQSGSSPELERNVRNALTSAGFDVGRVTVSTRGSTVVLHGTVRSAREKLLAIEIAFSVSAVQEVETALELEDSVTPEVEEEVWFVVLQEGLEDGIDRILVEDGIARVEAPSIDDTRRERLKRLVEGVPRVSSVAFESMTKVAEAPSTDPEPTSQGETVDEAVTAQVEPPPAAETMSSEGEVVEPRESRDESIETSSETPTPPTPEFEASAPETAEIEVPEPVVSEPEVPEPEVPEPEVPEPEVPEPEVPEPEVPEPEVPEPEVPEPEVLEPEPPESEVSEPEVPEPEVAEPEVPQPAPSPPISSSSAPASPSGANLALASDAERVGRDIVEQILTYPDYTVFDHIQLGMQPDAVRLVGFVTAAAKKEEIEARVASVAGDLRIENDIRVLLESSSDDTLRKRLFERIYQTPTFAAFADSENPPIHIIVEGGGVVLTGVVDRQIDASVAETIARNTFGVRRVENRLRVTTSIASP